MYEAPDDDGYDEQSSIGLDGIFVVVHDVDTSER